MDMLAPEVGQLIVDIRNNLKMNYLGSTIVNGYTGPRGKLRPHKCLRSSGVLTS
jgi:hypothetical protein